MTLDRGNGRDISRRPIKRTELGGRSPEKLRVLLGRRGSSLNCAVVGLQTDDAELVLVVRLRDLRANGDGTVELVENLSDESFLRCLASLDLAAGKLLKSAQCSGRSAPSAKHKAILNNDRADDVIVPHTRSLS